MIRTLKSVRKPSGCSSSARETITNSVLFFGKLITGLRCNPAVSFSIFYVYCITEKPSLDKNFHQLPHIHKGNENNYVATCHMGSLGKL